jgi:broad specificity phosphatase PhoE
VPDFHRLPRFLAIRLRTLWNGIAPVKRASAAGSIVARDISNDHPSVAMLSNCGAPTRMTPRLTLLCHASTDAVRRAAFPDDEPLDERGAAQAAAGRLRAADRSWTSPALRARQTAAALQLSAVPEPALRDCDFGCWRGRRLVDLQIEEPEAVASWLGDPAAAPHGGESILDVLHRVAGWLDERRRDAGHGIAVTHPAVIRAAIIHVIGAPPQAFWRIDVEPLSRTDLRRNGDRWTVRSTGCRLDDES